MTISDYITAEHPLGPYRHELLKDDLRASAQLTSNVRPFEQVFASKACMIIGRKGSGKTSVIQAYKSLASYGRTYGAIDPEKNPNGDLHINVIDWGHFHDIVRNVARRAAQDTDFAYSDDFTFPEAIAEIWAEEFWDLIFQSLYRQYAASPDLADHFPSIVELFESEDINNGFSNNYSDSVKSTFKKAMGEASGYFDSFGKKCFILIDSMDQYPIRSPLFSRVLSGFLRCINDFSYDHPAIKIVFCLPEELLTFFDAKSSNYVKDFGDAQRLDWRPSDLLRMVAERYRLGLNTIPGAVEESTAERLDEWDFSKREHLQDFFDDVMEGEIVNSCGQEEDPLAYIIRHTQLLPREFILIFNRAIRMSKEEIGSWRKLTGSAVRKAVEKTETELAKHVLLPYQTVFPQLIRACRSVLPELPPICEKSDLDRLGSRFKGRIEEDVFDVWETLYDIGILGYVDEDPTVADIDYNRYVYGYFKFTSTSPIAFRNDCQYCIHPLFSRLWSLKRPAGSALKFVYPANIEHFRAKLSD